jgi:hypothetical protein
MAEEVRVSDIAARVENGNFDLSPVPIPVGRTQRFKVLVGLVKFTQPIGAVLNLSRMSVRFIA